MQRSTIPSGSFAGARQIVRGKLAVDFFEGDTKVAEIEIADKRERLSMEYLPVFIISRARAIRCSLIYSPMDMPICRRNYLLREHLLVPTCLARVEMEGGYLG